jgi:hypothetical protein
MKTINDKKRTSVPWYLLLVIFFFSLRAYAANDCIVMDMTKGLSEQQKKEIEVLGAGWIKKAKVCNLGGYVVAAPADGPAGNLFIWKGDQRVLLIQEGFGVNIYEPVAGPRNRLPIVNLQDWDHDGLFDRLLYSVLDKDGSIKVELFDQDLDGVPETKVIHGQKDKTEFYAWIEEGWHKVEKKEGKPGVSIRGRWRQIRKEGARWMFVK